MTKKLGGRIRPWTVALFLLVLFGIPVLAWINSEPPWQIDVHDNASTSAPNSDQIGPIGTGEVNDGVVTYTYVHISGAVANSGVYSFAKDPRLIDAIQAAGGFTDKAAKESINLARKLDDGEHIHIMTLKEYRDAVIEGAISPGRNGGGTGGNTASGKASTKSSDGIDAAGRVNVNKATQAELETLPKIGPTLAGRILDWREKYGPFQELASLGAVSGIGPSILAMLDDLISF